MRAQKIRRTLIFFRGVGFLHAWTLQGYLAHKTPPPHRVPGGGRFLMSEVPLCYGLARGASSAFYERDYGSMVVLGVVGGLL